MNLELIQQLPLKSPCGHFLVDYMWLLLTFQGLFAPFYGDHFLAFGELFWPFSGLFWGIRLVLSWILRSHRSVFLSQYGGILDFLSLDMILEYILKKSWFLAKIPFNKIAEKGCVHKMCCMVCAAPDTTKTTTKVIDTKYSKHWPYTVAHTIECVCSKMNKSWFNPWFSFYFSSLYPAPYIDYKC